GDVGCTGEELSNLNLGISDELERDLIDFGAAEEVLVEGDPLDVTPALPFRQLVGTKADEVVIPDGVGFEGGGIQRPVERLDLVARDGGNAGTVVGVGEDVELTPAHDKRLRVGRSNGGDAASELAELGEVGEGELWVFHELETE